VLRWRQRRKHDDPLPQLVCGYKGSLNLAIRSLFLQLFDVGLVGGFIRANFTTSDMPRRVRGTNSFPTVPSGNQTGRRLNDFTDNNPPVARHHHRTQRDKARVGRNHREGGIEFGNGYGTPASTPTYYLRIYSVSGNTADVAHHVRARIPVSGRRLAEGAGERAAGSEQNYAFRFGIKPDNGGWAALAWPERLRGQAKIDAISIDGGTITPVAATSLSGVRIWSAGGGHQLARHHAMPNPKPMGGNLGNRWNHGGGYRIPARAPFLRRNHRVPAVFRIPCAWDFNSNQTNYEINSRLHGAGKKVVEWSIAAGMYCGDQTIHWDAGWLEN